MREIMTEALLRTLLCAVFVCVSNLGCVIEIEIID